MSTHTPEPSPTLDEYRTSIDALRFSDEEKAHMTARLVEAAQTSAAEAELISVAPHRKRRLSLAAIAAAAALALTLGGVAYATGSLISVQRFVSHLFGADEAKVEIIDKVGRPIGVAQSVNGVTVTADAIIGDQRNVAIVFSITKDDGTAFEHVDALENGLLPLGFSDHLEVDFSPVEAILGGYGANGSSYFYDADPTDNAIQLVETRSYQSDGASSLSLIGRTMTAHFSDLTYYGNGYDEPLVIAAGSWELSFPLDYEDASISLPTGQTFDLNGVSATIDELSISPIALHLRYTADQKVTWTTEGSGRQSEHDSKLSESLLGVSVTLTMTDGSTIAVPYGSGGMISEQGDVAVCETSIFFDRILDLDEVASITIGDTTIDW